MLGRLHDASSRALHALAALALAATAGLYLYEVAARYLFGAPTTWTVESVGYALAVVIFAGLPEATRRGAHVSVDTLPDALPPAARAALLRAAALLAALVTAGAAWIVAGEALRQFERGLLTNAANPIPRWPITAVIALGLASAALHLARHAAERRA